MSTRRGPYERPGGLGRGRKQVYGDKRKRRGKFRSPVGCNGDFNQHRGGHNGRGSFGRVGFGHGRGGGEAGNTRIMSSTGHTVHVHLNGHGDVDFATHATAQEGHFCMQLCLQSNPESGNNQGWGGSGGEHNFHGGRGGDNFKDGNFVGGEGNFNNGRNLNFGGGINNQANMGGFGGQGNQNTGFNNQPLRQEGSFNTQMQGGNFGPQAKFFSWCLHP